MMTFTPTTCFEPIGYREGVHHWSFKYWSGDAVKQACRIVELQLDDKYCPFRLPPTNARNANGTCIHNTQDSFDLFCTCCSIADRKITFLLMVGNQLIPLCDYERYLNAGLTSLLDFDEVIPFEEEGEEQQNLLDIVLGEHKWLELVARIYSRRHWSAVMDYCQVLLQAWADFFVELEKRVGLPTQFTEEEKEKWLKRLFQFPKQERFLFNWDDIQNCKNSSIEQYCASNYVTTVPRLEDMTSTPYCHTSFPWCFSQKRRSFQAQAVDLIIGEKERNRRYVNLERQLSKQQLFWDSQDEESEEDNESPWEWPVVSSIRRELLFLPPPSSHGISIYELVDPTDFNLSTRERKIINELLLDPEFIFYDYWPVITKYEDGFRNCIIFISQISLEDCLCKIFIATGELWSAKITIRHFEPGWNLENVHEKIDKRKDIVAIVAQIEPGVNSSLSALMCVYSALEAYLAADQLEVVSLMSQGNFEFMLIEIAGTIAAEVKPGQILLH
jgi:hypothetical protein